MSVCVCVGGGGNKLGICVGLSVRLPVYPCVLAHDARTRERIGTRPGMVPFDSPIRRKDDGVRTRSLSVTQRLPRGAGQTCIQSFVRVTGQTAENTGAPFAGHIPHRESLSFGGFIPKGCTSHVPGSETFNKGPSGFRKCLCSDTDAVIQ